MILSRRAPNWCCKNVFTSYDYTLLLYYLLLQYYKYTPIPSPPTRAALNLMLKTIIKTDKDQIQHIKVFKLLRFSFLAKRKTQLDVLV